MKPLIRSPLDILDWPALEAGLYARGYAIVPALLTARECAQFIAMYADDVRFRNTVSMQRHNFGRGEYRYFANPLPPELAGLRASAYLRLAPIANRWNESLGDAERYPTDLDEYVRECATAGQLRPTPLLLRYGAGDFNALHQDMYGERAFPFQCTVYLSSHTAYTGGETVLAFQRPRAQPAVRVLSFEAGDALIFANRRRRVRGTRGTYGENVRHGVSEVTSGERYALGIIFHNAR